MIVNPRELAAESAIVCIPSDRLLDIADEINGQISTVTTREFALLQRSQFFRRFKHVFKAVPAAPATPEVSDGNQQ